MCFFETVLGIGVTYCNLLVFVSLYIVFHKNVDKCLDTDVSIEKDAEYPHLLCADIALKKQTKQQQQQQQQQTERCG